MSLILSWFLCNDNENSRVFRKGIIQWHQDTVETPNSLRMHMRSLIGVYTAYAFFGTNTLTYDDNWLLVGVCSLVWLYVFSQVGLYTQTIMKFLDTMQSIFDVQV